MSDDKKVVSLHEWRNRHGQTNATVTTPERRLEAPISPGFSPELKTIGEGLGMDDVTGLISIFLGSAELKRKLDGLGVPLHKQKIAVQRAVIAKYTNEQLSKFINTATDSLLRQKPFFYYALLDEIAARHMKI